MPRGRAGLYGPCVHVYEDSRGGLAHPLRQCCPVSGTFRVCMPSRIRRSGSQVPSRHHAAHTHMLHGGMKHAAHRLELKGASPAKSILLPLRCNGLVLYIACHACKDTSGRLMHPFTRPVHTSVLCPDLGEPRCLADTGTVATVSAFRVLLLHAFACRYADSIVVVGWKLPDARTEAKFLESSREANMLQVCQAGTNLLHEGSEVHLLVLASPCALHVRMLCDVIRYA